MIRGVVNARREAAVRLRLQGPSGVELEVDAVIDTGFTSYLTLPAAIVTFLGLARRSGSSAVMADGSLSQFDIFAAEVLWDGAWRTILASGLGNETLMGMRMLAGYKLEIEVTPGGVVEIHPLP